MPNHSPEHMARLSKESASQRRADKLARLIATCPPLSEAQASRLRVLLESRVATPEVAR